MASQANQFTKVQFGTEGTYGTETSSYGELFRVQSGEQSAENGLLYERGLGEGINIVKTYLGPYTSAGSSTFNVVNFDFLQYWVGPKAGSGTAGSPYTLTEATTINLIPFSVEALNDSEATKTVWTQIGCNGTNFSLSGELNGILSCNASWIAQKLTMGTAAETYTPNTDNSFVMLNGTWKWGATPSTIAGVQSFSIDYTNGTSEDSSRSIESRFIFQPVLESRDYKGTVSILMTNALASTIITDFNNGSAITPNDGSSTINPTADLEFKIELVSGNKLANIHLDQCSIDRISRPFQVQGGLAILSFDFTAKSSASNVFVSYWSV